jgi:hypothetical protein
MQPSVVAVLSKAVVKGAEEALPTSVQFASPAGDRSKSTLATVLPIEAVAAA